MFAFPNAPSGPSQQPRYRKLIKQLLMNTIVLKGTRHEMRMGPSTTISEKMIFVRPERLPSPAAQRRIRPSVVEKHATFHLVTFVSRNLGAVLGFDRNSNLSSKSFAASRERDRFCHSEVPMTPWQKAALALGQN